MLKTILLVVALAVSVAAQIQSFNCINRDGSPAAADTLTYKVGSGNYNWLPIAMPVAGRCHIEVESFDDTPNIEAAVTDAAGALVGVKPERRGDIEILILTTFQWDQYVRGLRGQTAMWTSRRITDGIFDAKLPAGSYVLVLNNRFDSAKKSVTLTLGTDEPPAPTFAPTTRETRPNQTDQNKPRNY